VVKDTDLHPANLSTTLAGIHMMSHWWQQEGHLSKLLPCANKSRPTYLGMHVQVLEQGSQRREIRTTFL